MRARSWKALAARAAVVSSVAIGVMAQEHGGPQGGPGNRPRPPLELVLDANHDGVIDAAEIAGAATALKKLDKNKDGKLTGEEYRPQRPPRPEGERPDPR